MNRWTTVVELLQWKSTTLWKQSCAVPWDFSVACWIVTALIICFKWHCFISVFSSITMKHIEGALSTTYYFILSHIIFAYFGQLYVWAEPWDLCGWAMLFFGVLCLGVLLGFVYWFFPKMRCQRLSKTANGWTFPQISQKYISRIHRHFIVFL